MAADLSDHEFATLTQLAKSFARGTVSEDVAERLKGLGFAKELMGSLMITDSGSERLASGR